MEPTLELIDKLLVAVFDDLLAIEEETLKQGEFKDLSVKEMHTVEAVGMYEKKTVGEVSKILEVTLGTLTVAVDKLVRKGYVERNRCLEDRRIVFLSLTKKGKLLYRIHKQFHHDMVHEALSRLNREEESLLLITMDKLHRFLSSKYIMKGN